MQREHLAWRNFGPDFVAGMVVFFVALPFSLGIALASGVPLFAGVLASAVGGILVGLLSGSHTSVSGPTAGMSAVVAAELNMLGSFEALLMALVLAGITQIGMGWIRAGQLSAYIPSSVVKGLLAAIGIILILKQIPHLLGHDTDPEGDMSFWQWDHENTFSELGEILGDTHPGAALIGLISIVVLLSWERIKPLRESVVPAQLIVVLIGTSTSVLLRRLGLDWRISPNHLVQVPVATNYQELTHFLTFPDFSALGNADVYFAAVAIALIASLETLVNLEAVDRLDPQQRASPPNRELLAQGSGNVLCGLLGGLPVTSIVICSTVNIQAGARSKMATVVHGMLLLLCVLCLPTYLNSIPLSCLAAILLLVGCRLVNPQVIREMWDGGWDRFSPFLITVVAIIFTDLLQGVLIGLSASTFFILRSNLSRPLRRIVEHHIGGDVLRIELANQVSFLNKASIDDALNQIQPGGHVLLDARHTIYMDPDVLTLIHEFKERIAPARKVRVSLLGFQDKYLNLDDEIQYVDYSSRDIQEHVTPQQVLQILLDGNERFRTGRQLTRDYTRQMSATAQGQFPLAVVLSCIDSRTPAELIFDLGLGDIFNVRIAGNIISDRVLGSIEYGCAVAGAKLVLVLGHTRCGAVTSAVDLAASGRSALDATGCQHIDAVTSEIQQSIDPEMLAQVAGLSKQEKLPIIDAIAREHVRRTMRNILETSSILARLQRENHLDLVGGLYNVATGSIDFMTLGDVARIPA